jgi:magnesium-transporting ATPase (P-type)
LVALFVTLIPTTIGALVSAIGIADMDRLVRFNVLAMSGRAVEAAGDVDTLLLDKCDTITLGNRQATEVQASRWRDRTGARMRRRLHLSPTRLPRGAPSRVAVLMNVAANDATIVSVPKQRNRKEENKAIKAGKTPECAFSELHRCEESC